VIEEDVQNLGEQISDIIDQMEIRALIERTNSLSMATNWKIKNEKKVRDIWNLLEIVELTCFIGDKSVRDVLRFYDGYLIPLSNHRWVKILQNQNKINGCVYYENGKAYRILSDGKDKEFNCQKYDVKKVRGSEYFLIV